MANELVKNGSHYELNKVFQHFLRLMVGKTVNSFETRLVRRGDKVYHATEIVVGPVRFCIDYELEPRLTGRFFTMDINAPRHVAVDQHHIFPLVPWEPKWTGAEQCDINKAGDQLAGLEKEAAERAERFLAEQEK